MRTFHVIAMACLAGALLAEACLPAASAPIAAPSIAVAPEAQANAMRVRFAGWRDDGVWNGGGWRDRAIADHYRWRHAYDDACSGDHRFIGAYAGYPGFWCSPGFGLYYRHWPR
jgi:hypothetical protein